MTIDPTARHSSAQALSFRESLLAILGISFVFMLVGLDQTVVGTALPTIVSQLKGFELYAWVATSYLLTSVITVPIFGRLGDYYGRKPFVVASIVVFTGASVLCGMANDMLWLVFARGLQGVGGGMLIGTALACIPDLFPDSVVRLRWQALISAAFGIANAIGPSLGGVMTQYYGWRSVFYVNVPVGLLSLFFVWRYLPRLRHVEHDVKMRVDWLGALLIALMLGAFQLFVEWLPKYGIAGWSTSLLVIALVSAAVLWHWEKRCTQPILPFDMFANRALSTLFVLSILSGFSMFSVLFYAPLLFQGGFGMSPKDAGVAITPLVVFITIGSIVNGRIVTRIRNPNVMLQLGCVLLALACVGIAVARRATPESVLMALMAVGGIGLGFVLPNLTIFAQQMAGRPHLGIATALLQSLRMVGGMIGTAITGTLVGQMYGRSVRHTLGADHALHWSARLADPQVLIDRQAQRLLMGEMTNAGHNGVVLLESARESLVAAIHLGMAVAAVVAAYAVWHCGRMPFVKLYRAVESTVLVD
ncbi:disulfide bond formation protein DsbA [Burkholderia diffusa]|uniref:Disulfide bond formation protein DsbA n=1 Tax=Burkholderia diffusa TaxID=488732 RepID=A0AAW3P9Y4_9BURK|nr:MFS transporter [Burkholderia diffusa]KWF32968.1 disulfide bond formation protein DsbA [Burkholderia diffusa]KWF38890.1 disulfide bond formation protein DsbA [Burkholderia diffusa]KWF46937.1 disulfide bond formation protein DsbA [Burkholderia diffusa]KWF50630.1 disulfide bond formation protein DsbA [Burkholderia diffusa]